MRSLFILLLCVFASGFVLDGVSYAQDDQAEFDKKIESTDFTDPESLYELAKWAMANKSSGKIRSDGRKYMKEVIEIHPNHEGARDALGYEKVGQDWYQRGKEADKARKEIMAEEMKEKGYVWYKNGWIKKTEKRDWNKNWEKDGDGVWISYEDVMKAKGYSLYKGEWLQMGEGERKSMEHHRKMTGEDILVMGTPHFRFHTTIPPEYAKKYSELSETVYDWYMEKFQVTQPRSDNFFGRQVHIWTFETQQQFQDWVTVYSETYEFDDEDKKQFRENPSGWLLSGKLIATIVAEDAKDVENSLLHDLGVLFIRYHIYGITTAWQSEAMGHLVEELFSGDKFGKVNMSSQSKYANGGGIAGKDYNTKDGRPQAKGIVKAGDDISIRELSQMTLNTLNQDHLAQGFSILEYLYHNRLQDLVGMIRAQSQSKAKDGPGVVDEAIQNGTGKPAADLERDWRAYVKKNYK